MSLESDVHKVTQYYLSEQKNKINGDPRVNQKQLDKLSEKILQKILEQKIDFSDLANSCITQKKYLENNKKKRRIKKFSEPEEDVLSICVKRYLDRIFKIKFPNRNRICKTLFSTIPAIAQMLDFTIIRFDFKDYFNSLNSQYVFHKFIKTHIAHRNEYELIEQYVEQTCWAYCGLRASNSIAEIIGLNFDNILKALMHQYGVIYYERYIDDGLVILNSYLNKTEAETIIKKAVQITFYDEDILKKYKITNHVKINDNKSSYISSRDAIKNARDIEFNFLGYFFKLTPNTILGKKGNPNKFNITYGISKEKQLKNLDRLRKLIRPYYILDKTKEDEHKNLTLLEHRIRCFTTRQVYVLRHLKSYTWKTKGLISNYGELRYLTNTELLDKETKSFLSNAIYQIFNEFGGKIPQFVSNYNLLKNMEKNKTMLFVRGIGYDHKSLIRICKQVGIKPKSYDGLVRDYLIKMKVGY